MPEWGIVHSENPAADNREWTAVYRGINGSVIPGFVLAARIMGVEDAWNHKALFDYADRWMKTTGGRGWQCASAGFRREHVEDVRGATAVRREGEALTASSIRFT